MNIKTLKGIIYVGIGAASYGVLAVCVKLGTREGYTTGEITFSQALIGCTILILLNLFARVTSRKNSIKYPDSKERLKLIAGGIPLGLTSTFYYIALQYVSVSVCIVLLMQSVWMGSVIDLIINKTKPTISKIVAIIIVLIGTALATNLINSEVEINVIGICWGLLAAFTFTLTMSVSNKVAIGYSPIVRSMFMLIGSVVIVSLIWGYSLITNGFDVSVLWKWGIILALFGTVLPPLLFTKGFPLAGLGVGSIVASIELPVSVLAAFFILKEPVSLIQWVGIILILAAIFLMNITALKK